MDGKAKSLVVCYQIDLLQECSPKGVLGVVRGSSQWEIVRIICDVGIVGGQLKIKGCVRKVDCNGLAAVLASGNLEQ